MIRIRYSNDEVKEYRTIGLAKFMVINEMFASRGGIIPVEAWEVMGVTTGGVTVERDLAIKLGAVEFE